jgi:hypothetical protein
MTQRHLLLVLALLATVAWTGTAQGVTWYHNCWQASADGSQDCYSSEGYASAPEGNYRFTKGNQHFTFMAFDGVSDNSDGSLAGHGPGFEDGVLLSQWMADKKVVVASLYFRITDEYCDLNAGTSAILNDPITILGFRVSNQGQFNDRGINNDTPPVQLSGGKPGCCASYNAPLVDRGMMAPPAWRMGRADYHWTVDTTGYNLRGDIGDGLYTPGVSDPVAEYYKVTNFSSQHQGLPVNVTQSWFCSAQPPISPIANPTAYDQGGWTAHPPGMSGSGRWAFGWLVENGDGMMFNSSPLIQHDCSGAFGGAEEPRDGAADDGLGAGWYAKQLDNGIIYAMSRQAQSEVKGLVFSSITSPLPPGGSWNTAVYGRDQSGGQNGPYIWMWQATIAGDCALPLDSCDDVSDLLAMAGVWGAILPGTAQATECDLNYDGQVDVSDLLGLAAQYGNCVTPGALFTYP